ncbi:hypothetical protein L5F50_03690 [Aliarcobacter butzleri]|nr:hypothetical protein [Aliarcobacter butzleri]
MVNFSVFNELSLPLTDKNLFNDFFDILNILKEKRLNKIRMEKDFKAYPEILPNICFSEFFSGLNKEEKTRIRSFLANSICIIETPLIFEIPEEYNEYDDMTINTYSYNEIENLGGLASGFVWNTIVISFNSDPEWNTSIVKIKKNTDEVEVKHISNKDNVLAHKNFFNEYEKELQKNITVDNFWEQRKELFSKIIFCDEVKEQINLIDKNILIRDIKFLRDIETSKKSIHDFNIHNEGETVRTNVKLRSLREFYIDNEKKYFEKHIIRSSGHRIHFLEENEKIYIGYIGKHLETKKFKA